MMKIRIVYIPNKLYKYRIEVFNAHSIVYSIDLYNHMIAQWQVRILHRKYVYKK